MARPALSASRGLEIIDFLAAFPGRAFTLSDIARAAKMNVASCHAVLHALVGRGYLRRDEAGKTYVLGPALVAVGSSAIRSNPLVARAQTAAEELSRDMNLPVLLTAVVGDDILAVASVPDASGRSPAMRVGQRMPLVPPVGAPFLAWSNQAAIDAWIARMAPSGDRDFIKEWRRALAEIRKRGYQVSLRAPESRHVATLMAEMASARKETTYKEKMIDMIHSVDERVFHPKSIDDDKKYEVALIAAPIFEKNGEAAFSLCLTELPRQLTGATIKTHAERLIGTCLQVMREDRAA
ncbi:MAG TPA: helix-turn-helix domain-containing protein [Steroidobacteraceae bacterium]|nr:helix-turn-helix domain-containing protein [Steroidobacteraceae bacterium]